MSAAIRGAYAIPNFFDTCGRVKAERNVAVSIGSICPKQTGELRHVEALFEKKQTSE
jgi:DNA-directed RNA polymerase subunit F